MFPSLAQLAPDSKRPNVGSFELDDIPAELLVQIVSSSSDDVHKLALSLCATNWFFKKLCDEGGVWKAFLRYLKWGVDWDTGLTSKEFFEMTRKLSDTHRTRLLNLDKTTTTIEAGAFKDCEELSLKALPPNITTIGDSAFENCELLALTSLPPKLIKIGARAFYDCDGISLTTLPETVTTIGRHAFVGCDNLALESLPPKLTVIQTSTFIDCKKLVLNELPPNITTIKWRAFSGCDNLRLAELPPSLTSIRSGAFIDCNNLSRGVKIAILNLNPQAFETLNGENTVHLGV